MFFFGTRFQANRWKRWYSIKVESLKQLVFVDIRKKRGHRDSLLRVFTIWWPQESRFAILLLIWVGKSRQCLYSCGGLAAKCTRKFHMHRWFAHLRTATTTLREGEFLGAHPPKKVKTFQPLACDCWSFAGISRDFRIHFTLFQSQWFEDMLLIESSLVATLQWHRETQHVVHGRLGRLAIFIPHTQAHKTIHAFVFISYMC